MADPMQDMRYPNKPGPRNVWEGLGPWGVPVGPQRQDLGQLPMSVVPTNPDYQPPPSQPEITAVSQAGGQGEASPPKMGGYSTSGDYGKMQALIDQLKSRGESALDMQKQGIGQQEGQMQALAGMPMRASIAPMIGLVDSLWGTNLSKSYVPPSSPQERMAQMQQLQQGIQKAKFGLSENEATMLKDVLHGQGQLTDIKERGREADQRAQELALATQDRTKGKNDKADAEAMTKYQMDLGKRTSKIQESLGEVGKAKADLMDAVKNGSANVAAPVLIARSVVNRLNERELAAFSGDPSFKAKAEAILTKATTGGMTVHNRDQLLKVVDILEQFNKKQMNSIAQDVAGAYSKRSNKPLKDAYDQVIGGRYETYGTLPEDSHPVDTMSDDEVIKAYQAKFGGAK